MAITNDEKRPHDQTCEVDLEAFFVGLPNSRRFGCDSAQLCLAFVSMLTKSGATPFRNLEELDLSSPKSMFFPAHSLLELPSLTSLTLAKYGVTAETPHDVEDREPILLPRLGSISLELLNGDIQPCVQLFQLTCNLRLLAFTSFRPNEDCGALLKAASDLSTIHDPSLSRPRKKSWDLVQHLRPFEHHTRLDVGGRCAVRAAETVAFLREQPLEYLRFGPGAILSADRLLTLVSGTAKHRRLKKLVLDNVSAMCDDFRSWDWWDGSDWCEECDRYGCFCDDGYFEYMIFASDWLDHAYVALERWNSIFFLHRLILGGTQGDSVPTCGC
ncbi:hypothetical protein Rt10032_c12g4734 [Rhodotorula toruloides]|uniref:Proteophosphoglycan ppg4 n=1 Tax=Rhodotorula toruloides TaxID=5286 RepID=A0A511KK06_RHOTO|nr:hypothetical protein Rt10032_c12g4734 [Rhodotorula toruloides]